jgi:hypothetical protein
MRVDHPLHSPALSPCDFWLCVLLKNRIKKTAFRDADAVEDCGCNSGSEATSGEVSLLLCKWMKRFEWVSELDGGHVPEYALPHLHPSSKQSERVAGESLAPLDIQTHRVMRFIERFDPLDSQIHSMAGFIMQDCIV